MVLVPVACTLSRPCSPVGSSQARDTAPGAVRGVRYAFRSYLRRLGKVLWILVISFMSGIGQGIDAGWNCTRRAMLYSTLCWGVSMVSGSTEIFIVEDKWTLAAWLVKVLVSSISTANTSGLNTSVINDTLSIAAGMARPRRKFLFSAVRTKSREAVLLLSQTIGTWVQLCAVIMYMWFSYQSTTLDVLVDCCAGFRA